MTIDTLKELVIMEFDRADSIYILRQNIIKIIEMYTNEINSTKKQMTTNSSQPEISYEEIDREAVTNEFLTTFDAFEKFCWKEGAKWYKEKLKNKK